MKRAVEIATDDNFKGYIDAVGLLLLGVFTLVSNELRDLWAGTSLETVAQAFTIIGMAGTGLRSIWVFFDWQERRERIEQKKEAREKEQAAIKKFYAKQNRLMENMEDMKKPDVRKASSAKELAEIRKRNAREKFDE